ncbi:MAG: ureidoglycolate lyase [Christensenellales bacterium]
MRKINAKPISVENFMPFGYYTNVLHPTGNNLGEFYYDKIRFPVSGEMPIALSPSIVRRTERMLITMAECHSKTCEGIFAVDDDMILHLAPPTLTPKPELTEAFIIQQGMAVCIHAGVWHLSAIPLNKKEAHVLIILPERTYYNDCITVNYEEKDYMEVLHTL